MARTIRDLIYQLGRRMRARRQAKGFSQEHVAHEAGISSRHYYLIETGAGNPTAATLYSIARALGVNLRDLVGDDDKSSPRRK